MFVEIYRKIKRLFSRKEEPYFSLYQMLGFYPKNIRLYEQAFIHRSSSIDTGEGKWQNNERLEFLGDAVLNAIIADIVFHQFPNRREGFLTNTRSKIVQRESLNRIAIEIGLDKLIVLSPRISLHHSFIYGNAFEALIGAIYLDQGYRKCHAFVKERIIDRYISLDKIAHKEVNFKSQLLEWSQKNRLEITYELIEMTTDEEGSPVFQTSVSLHGTTLGLGIGHTKKESQQLAAKKALKRIRRDKAIQQLINKLKTINDNGKENDVSEYPA